MTTAPRISGRWGEGRALLAAGALAALSGCWPDPAPPEPRPFTAIEAPRFPHDQHVTRMHLACVECHHETDAVRLVTPHPSYLTENRVDCPRCHHGTDRPREPQACAHCHPATPADVADETLSAKVVIHRTCWRCHPIGDGTAASGLCGTCHGTKKPPVASPMPHLHPLTKGPR
jgi:hypothetical protein